MFHLPGAGFVAVSSRSESADGADIDAHPALFALEVIFPVRNDSGTHATVLDSQSPNIHAFAANTHAAVAQDAAGPIEIHYRRPLLLVAMMFEFDVAGIRSAVGKRHVLQFAFATRITDRTI